MDTTKIIAIAACVVVILVLIVLSSKNRIHRTYKKYMRVDNKMNLSGKDFAFISKEALGLKDLQFALVDGKLTDAYSPKYKTLLMSEEVCNTASLSSIAIVSHELGHAMQHKEDSGLFFLNQMLAKFTHFANKFIIPLLVLGLASFIFKYPNDSLGITLMLIAVVLFGLHVLHLVVLIPLEYDASRRALKYLKQNNFITNAELHKAKKLLGVAAQTYIANLLDSLFIFAKKKGKRRKKR
ncbi:MAG: zinc metallopeptidase [Clostridiales bacterium]|nr:zinc metallopeptidase [Clostridiales bacterium]